MSKLFDLVDEHGYLYGLLTDGTLDDQSFIDSLDACMFDERLEEKADGYAAIDKMLEAEISTIKAELDRLGKRKSTLERNKSELRNRLLAAMNLIGRDRIKTALNSFTIQLNSERVIIDDLEIFKSNMEWWKPYRYEESNLDKQKIKDSLKSGAVIPAHLERSESLRIR